MREAFREVWRNPYVRVLVALGLAYLFGYFVWRTWTVWWVTLLSALIAALVRPVLVFFQRRGAPKPVAFALVVLLLLLILVAFWLGLVAVVGQLSGLVGTLPEEVARGAQEVRAFWERLGGWVPGWARPYFNRLPEDLAGLVQQLSHTALAALGRWVQSGLIPTLAAVLGGAVDLVVGFFLFLYFLWDGEAMLQSLYRRTPPAYRGFLRAFGEKLERAVVGYFRGQLTVAASMGLLVGVGLFLLGLPMPAVTGFLVAVFELIPFLGVALGMAFTALAALSLGWGAVFTALLVFVVAGEFEGHVLAPLIMARATQLHPVTVLLALLVGAELGGLVGALVVIPLVALAKALAEDYFFHPRAA